MESYSQLIGDLGRVFNQLKQSVFQIFPNVIAALAIFILGWLCARLIRRLIERFLTNLAHLIPNRTIQRDGSNLLAEVLQLA